MKTLAALLLTIIAGSTQGHRVLKERCQIIDAMMDGRVPSQVKSNGKPFKDKACIKGSMIEGRFRIRAHESNGESQEWPLLAPGEICSAGYEGVGEVGEPGVFEKPGTYEYIRFEVHPGNRMDELRYSGGLNIKVLDKNGDISTIGMACGGSTRGRIRRVGGKWIPVAEEDNARTPNPRTDVDQVGAGQDASGGQANGVR